MSVFHNLYDAKIQEITNEVEQEKRGTLFAIWYSYYSTVVSTFQLGNLPKYTLNWQPEDYLFYTGLVGFIKNKGDFKDDAEYKILPCFGSGRLLSNGEYSEYTLFTKNGETYIRPREEIALCYNNNQRIPSSILVSEFAQKSSYALEAVDTSLRRSMLPSVWECESESDLQTALSLHDKDKTLRPYVVTMSDGLSKKSINVVHPFDNRNYDVLAQWDIYVRYRNLFYTTFGINNVEIQKRERLTEAEGSGNDEITRYTLLKEMYARRMDFVDEVKEKFNYTLTLEINRDSATVYEIRLTNDEKIENVETDLLKGVNYGEQTPKESEEKVDEDSTVTD